MLVVTAIADQERIALIEAITARRRLNRVNLRVAHVTRLRPSFTRHRRHWAVEFHNFLHQLRDAPESQPVNQIEFSSKNTFTEL